MKVSLSQSGVLNEGVSVPEWSPGSEGYLLSGRRDVALRNDSAQSRCPVIYSNMPSYFCGQTLTFK